MRSANNWPKSDFVSMNNFYGDVGENQCRVRTPYPLRLSWDLNTSINRITVHRKTANSIQRVLENIFQLYGHGAIRELNLDIWAGCLNVRKMRGGSNKFSIHSWGAAHDWYPSENGLRVPWHLSKFSDPVYIDFINAFIYEGWEPLGLSLGRDAMHFQATENLIQPLSSNNLLAGMG